MTSGGRPKCGAQRPNSALLCTQPAGWGTIHPGTGCCKRHGGSTPTQVLGAQRELARQAVVAYGLPRDIPADIALLEEVARTAGHVAALGKMVDTLPADALAWGIAEQTTRRTVILGDADTDDEGEGSAEGWVIDTKRKAAPNVLITMFLTERKHLLEVCKTVAGLEIEERRERRAERQATQFAAVVRLLLADLALTPTQQAQVPAALRSAVAALTAAEVA